MTLSPFDTSRPRAEQTFLNRSWSKGKAVRARAKSHKKHVPLYNFAQPCDSHFCFLQPGSHQTGFHVEHIFATILITSLNLCPNLGSCYRCCCRRRRFRQYCRRRRLFPHLRRPSANVDPLLLLLLLLSPCTAVPPQSHHGPGRVFCLRSVDSGPEARTGPAASRPPTSSSSSGPPKTTTGSRSLYCNWKKEKHWRAVVHSICFIRDSS